MGRDRAHLSFVNRWVAAPSLNTQTWARVFAEAAALGVLQVHLSGGEPGARRDLVAIMAAALSRGPIRLLIRQAGNDYV